MHDNHLITQSENKGQGTSKNRGRDMFFGTQ
jgi:hypothetical protein